MLISFSTCTLKWYDGETYNRLDFKDGFLERDDFGGYVIRENKNVYIFNKEDVYGVALVTDR